MPHTRLKPAVNGVTSRQGRLERPKGANRGYEAPTGLLGPSFVLIQAKGPDLDTAVTLLGEPAPQQAAAGRLRLHPGAYAGTLSAQAKGDPNDRS